MDLLLFSLEMHFVWGWGNQILVLQCQGLKSLVLRGCYRVNDGFVIFLAKNSTRIEKLDLFSADSVTNGVLLPLGRNCIHLRWVDFGESNVTDAGTTELAAHLPFVFKDRGPRLRPVINSAKAFNHYKEVRITVPVLRHDLLDHPNLTVPFIFM